MPTTALPYGTRSATGDDIRFLYEVIRTTMRSHVEAIWGEWEEEWQWDRFSGGFRPDIWQVILVDEKPVGGYAVEYRATELYLANLHVLPEYQGMGIGSSIVRALLAKAASHGLPVTLSVLRPNVGAYRLYGRLGFRSVREDEQRFWMESTLAM